MGKQQQNWKSVFCLGWPREHYPSLTTDWHDFTCMLGRLVENIQWSKHNCFRINIVTWRLTFAYRKYIHARTHLQITAGFSFKLVVVCVNLGGNYPMGWVGMGGRYNQDKMNLCWSQFFTLKDHPTSIPPPFPFAVALLKNTHARE